MKRASGILMPIFSLPSPYGIGSLGKCAYNFIDFLAQAGQSLWQILPIGPTSYGDSPYQSFSSFAGNPYFIDLDMLACDGLLEKAALEGLKADGTRVDYAYLYETRFELLHKAYERDTRSIEAFKQENPWLCDYALFMALKKHFDMKPWYAWDEDIKLRKPEAVKKYKTLLNDDIRFYEYIQFLFYSQWQALHDYARKKGIKIIGDMPIYVAMDSADVWAEPQYFLLDEKNVPTAVAGVPPDYFSEDGQLWGNPLYDYDAMRADGYGWWIRRVDGASKLFDVIRIDHFRGFESFWAVPYGADSAKEGKWVKGPGLDLVGRLTSWFSDTEFIAEDLGILTDEVRELLKASGLPGMRVLQFAFDPDAESDYLPHRHERNSICYTGTHDNMTLQQWLNEAPEAELSFAKSYLGLNEDEGCAYGIIRAGMMSVCDVFIAQMQDWLLLGKDARINTPGTMGGNWTWRVDKSALTPELAEKIRAVTKMYGRLNVKED